MVGPPGCCVLSPVCGQAMVIEHNGDIYSSDHFVVSDHLPGTLIADSPEDIVDSPRQRQFGQNRRDDLPGDCRRCQFLFACHGECPRNRFLVTPDGEPGLNYLCGGYRLFFAHIAKPMESMARELHASGLRPLSGDMWRRRPVSQRLSRSTVF